MNHSFRRQWCGVFFWSNTSISSLKTHSIVLTLSSLMNLSSWRTFVCLPVNTPSIRKYHQNGYYLFLAARAFIASCCHVWCVAKRINMSITIELYYASAPSLFKSHLAVMKTLFVLWSRNICVGKLKCCRSLRSPLSVDVSKYHNTMAKNRCAAYFTDWLTLFSSVEHFFLRLLGIKPKTATIITSNLSLGL